MPDKELYALYTVDVRAPELLCIPVSYDNIEKCSRHLSKEYDCIELAIRDMFTQDTFDLLVVHDEH